MASNKKSGRARWVIILSAIVLIVGGALWYFKGRDNAAVQYLTAKISRGEITQVVTASGALNPVVNVTVGSQISGRIAKLYADFNSAVTQGQVIAEIDPSTYKANVARAEADLSSARASLELSQVEARRATQLFTNSLLSASEYDAAIAGLHQAEAAMQIRDAALNSAKVDLGRCTIFSPVDGVVISRSVDVGQTVAASMSAPVLFQIASDLTKMRINASVAEADVGSVAEGQEVEFTVDAFPTRTFFGKVTQVRNAPVTVQSVVTYDTVIEVSNADLKLKPGMTANVSIIIEQREGVLKIPNAALRFRPPEDTVLSTGTNALAQAGDGERSRTNRMFAAGEQGRRRDGQGGRGGGQGGGRGLGRSGGGSAERRTSQTVYVLPGGTNQLASANVKFKPVRIRLGVTDGIFTEILDGLSENDVLVTGSSAPTVAQASPAVQNPFSGGQRGGGGGGGRRF